MNKMEVLFLAQSDVRNCVPNMKQMIAVAEEVFTAHARRKDIMPPGAIMDIEDVVGHMGSSQAYLETQNARIAGMKWLTRYVNNPREYDLPTLTSIIIINDVQTGMPLCIMEGSLLTAIRTGAASAAGAIHLAKPKSRRLAVIGASVMAEYQIRALSEAISLEEIAVFDIVKENAKRLAATIRGEFDVCATVHSSYEEVAEAADIIVTATSASSPFLRSSILKPGTLLISIGSKPELCSDVFDVVDKIVPDTETKCRKLGALVPYFKMGEGVLIHSEIGDIITGKKPGRETDKEIILYVPMGMATEDVAAAYYTYLNAVEKGVGCRLALF